MNRVALDILVTGGGIIPKEDMDALEQGGMGRLFGPGTPSVGSRQLHQGLGRGTPRGLIQVTASQVHPRTSRLRTLSDEYLALAARAAAGRGAKRIAKMHEKGSSHPRAGREAAGSRQPWLEIGLLVAYDQYEGQAPAAGVITGLGRGRGPRGRGGGQRRDSEGGLLVAGNRSRKILRAQEIAMRQRIPDHLSGGLARA